MEQKKHWWQDIPLTISAVQCNLGDDDEWVLDEYVSKYGFNTEQLLHIVAKGHIGSYSEEEHGEKLRSYLKKSRQYGIREIVYTNTHCVKQEIVDKHPEWQQLTKEGKPMPAYGMYTILCCNPDGPWHKNFLKEVKYLASHDVDGIFLDGPLMRDTGCYCDACRATFEKRFGHSIYEATRIELQTMRVESVTRHMKETYETVKQINPECALYINNSALRADITGSNTRKIYDYVDILGAEGGFHRAALGDGLWQISSHAKHLEGIEGDTLAGKKPLVCFFAGNLSGTAYYMHTPAETLLSYAQSYANGSNVWYGVHFSASEFKDTEAALMAKTMNEFVLSHKDIFGPSKVCARVAVMWSQDTANNYASSVLDSDFVAERKAGFKERGDHRGELMSVFNMLERNHIQFDIIDEVSVLNGTIDTYDAVILPNVACMSDDVSAKITSYVENGGNLLANFDVGMYNADGSFAGASKLADVFGFKGVPKINHSPYSTTYLFQAKDDALLDTISFPRIPAPTLNAEWSFTDDTDVLMRINHPMPGVYASLPGVEDQYPAITKHAYGKGCAYYICGNFGELVRSVRNILDYEKIIRRFCDLSSRPTVVSDGCGLYEVVLRKQENRFIMHVINLTGAMERPLEKIVPLHNVEFTLDLSGFGIEKDTYTIRSVRGAGVENVKADGNHISFMLDKLDAYEIVVIE